MCKPRTVDASPGRQLAPEPRTVLSLLDSPGSWTTARGHPTASCWPGARRFTSARGSRPREAGGARPEARPPGGRGGGAPEARRPSTAACSPPRPRGISGAEAPGHLRFRPMRLQSPEGRVSSLPLGSCAGGSQMGGEEKLQPERRSSPGSPRRDVGPSHLV